MYIVKEMEPVIVKSTMSINTRLIAFGDSVHIGRIHVRNELSRTNKKTIVCPECGTREVIDAYISAPEFSVDMTERGKRGV